MLKRKTIKYQNSPASLNWHDGALIDWVGGGNIYTLEGEFRFSGRRYAYKFDMAIQSDNGAYAVIYERRGTKGLLLKNGEILREINRSYYQAEVYEFPIAFLKLKNGEYAIVHCPSEYNLIEIEAVETGKKITSFEGRKPVDCFHSRFRADPSSRTLINAGWAWHPYGILNIYDIGKAIADNTIFDQWTEDLDAVKSYVCSAEFLDEKHIVISMINDGPLDEDEVGDDASLYSHQIGLYSVETNKLLKKTSLDFKNGTLVPMSKDYVIDLYKYPKVLDLNTGKIIQKFENIYSGKQSEAISYPSDNIPPMAIDIENKRLAIGADTSIEVLSWE